MQPKLWHKDGREAKVGDYVLSFRGEPYVIAGWPKDGGPKHLGLRNRVWVKPDGIDREDEFYPTVFNLSWDEPNSPVS